MARNPVTKNLAPARYTLSYTDIDDPNAIKTSIATVAAQVTYSGADLDGVMANPGPALTKMHRLSVTTSANAGTYTLSTITAVTADQNGNARTLQATLTAVNGNETVEFTDVDGNDVGALSVTSITIPAMNDINGSFEFGVTDVVFDEPCRQLRGGLAGGGDIAVDYEAETTSAVVVTDVLACIEGERHDAFFKKILDTGTTAFPVTAYI